MPQVIDLTGRKYGRLTVLGFDHKNSKRVYFWKCRCECGKDVVIAGYNLKSGNTKSCGCLGETNRQRLESEFTKAHKTHGLSATRINRTYRHMKERCFEKSSKDYFLYGGRGIGIDSEWLGEKGFEHFYEWSMQNGYSDKLTIDRIDNNRNYGPDNCRWADARTQANNRRTNVVYDIGNGPQTRAELCREYGMGYNKVRNRVQSGWTIEEALEIVPHKRRFTKPERVA